MRRLALVTLSLMICLSGSARADGDPDEIGGAQQEAQVQIVDADGFFDENFGDLQEELEAAREEGKRGMLIMFEMAECPFCKRMKRTVLNRSDVQDYFREHFRIISVDTEGDMELTDFEGNTTTEKVFALKQFRVRATPVFLFLDDHGKPLKNGRLTGATKNVDEFLLLGRFIVEGHNESTSFSRFKRQSKTSSLTNTASGPG